MLFRRALSQTKAPSHTSPKNLQAPTNREQHHRRQEESGTRTTDKKEPGGTRRREYRGTTTRLCGVLIHDGLGRFDFAPSTDAPTVLPVCWRGFDLRRQNEWAKRHLQDGSSTYLLVGPPVAHAGARFVLILSNSTPNPETHTITCVFSAVPLTRSPCLFPPAALIGRSRRSRSRPTWRKICVTSSRPTTLSWRSCAGPAGARQLVDARFVVEH